MSWTQSERITQMVGEMNSVLDEGKCGFLWQTLGRMTRYLATHYYLPFYERRFGLTPNCFIVNAQPCGCISSNKSKFLQKAAGNKHNEWVWDNGSGCIQNAILCHNQFMVLPFMCSISHCSWMGITIEVEKRSSLIIAIPLPLHLSFNKQQTQRHNTFPKGQRYEYVSDQIWYCMTNTVGKHRYFAFLTFYINTLQAS